MDMFRRAAEVLVGRHGHEILNLTQFHDGFYFSL
jgi:hypothetical protein